MPRKMYVFKILKKNQCFFLKIREMFGSVYDVQSKNDDGNAICIKMAA